MESQRAGGCMCWERGGVQGDAGCGRRLHNDSKGETEANGKNKLAEYILANSCRLNSKRQREKRQEV